MTDTITTQPEGIGNTQPIEANVVTQPPLPPGYVSVPPQQGYGNLPPGYCPPQPQQGYDPPPQYQQPGYPQCIQQQWNTQLPPMYGGMPMQALPRQPQKQVEWMAKPIGDPKCPPGLEYLTVLDQILTKQMIEPMEMITGFEMENKYRILNSMGQQCYFAMEESNMLDRQMYHSTRGFTIHVTDNMGVEVMRFSRQNTCCGNCTCCTCNDAPTELIVEAPIGKIIGKVRLDPSCMNTRFNVLTPSDEVMLNIVGPCCPTCSCSDVEFAVRGIDGSDVGNIRKQWSGVAQESMTDATNFGITFKQDLDVLTKAILMGATILIDFVFYERSNENNRRNRRIY